MTSNILTISETSKSIVMKSVKVYNDDIPEYDYYDGSPMVDCEFGEIQETEDYESAIVFDQGSFIIDGFIEGYAGHDWVIRNKVYDFIPARGNDDYFYETINESYIENYEIIDTTSGRVYPLTGNTYEKGYLTFTKDTSTCDTADFVIRLFRRDTSAFVGEYEFDGTSCTIYNLYVGCPYDAVLFDRNTLIESRVMSNRSPTPV